MVDATALDYSMTRPMSAADVTALLHQTPWATTRLEVDVAQMLAASVCAGAWDSDRLVGFARVLTDGVYRTFLEDVVVDEAYRGGGIGDRLVRYLLENIAPVEDVILTTSENRRAFYERMGFHSYDAIHMNTKPKRQQA